MTPADLSALWDAARATLTAPVDIELLRLAREGHLNRCAIVDLLMPEECPTCAPGTKCAGYDTYASEQQREVIERLSVALKEGGTT